ncbi:MAG: ABC transporter ATP-binding protein [Propionibacteriaceae bacterium]
MTSMRLGADGISRRFGPTVALDRVSFGAERGHIHALLGENGAGKTTLIRALSGLDQPDDGTVLVDGEPTRFKGPRDAFTAGIAVVQQELALSPHLTMLENLVLGIEPVRRGRIDWKGARRRAEEIAESIGAEIPWHRQCTDVPIGARQQLEIVRALYRGADTLILDEPSAVLAPSQIEGLLDLLRKLRDQGTTIILITHKLEEVLAVADAVTVLRGGHVVHSQADVDLNRTELAELVVGEHITTATNQRSAVAGDVVLTARGLLVRGRQQSVGPMDLEVRAGEILGIAGVAGNGQDDLVEAIVGVRPILAGTLSLAGDDITHSPVDRRRAAGIGYISADRKEEGLSVTESLADNVVLGGHRTPPVGRGGRYFARRARAQAAEVLAAHSVRHGSVTDPASTLSGGNQQKVVVGRELSFEPAVLVAAQPTRGVDVKGIRDLHRELLAARDRGVAIVLMSQELDELQALCDQIIVMHAGVRNGTFDPDETGARQLIGAAMLGSSGESTSDPEPTPEPDPEPEAPDVR